METATATETVPASPSEPRRNSSMFKKISTTFGLSPGSKTKSVPDTNGGTPIKSPRDMSGPLSEAAMRQEMRALQLAIEEANTAEKMLKERVHELQAQVSEVEVRATGEAVAAVGSVSLWSKVYFSGAVLSAAFLWVLAGGSPVAAWLALTQEPAVGADILMSTGNLDWRPAAAVGALFVTLSLACLAAVTGQAIRGVPRRAGVVALLAVDAAFFLHFQGAAKQLLRTHAVQAGAKAGFRLEYEKDIPVLLVALDALMLLGPGLVQMALLHSRPQKPAGDVARAVQSHLGWLRATLPLLQPVLFRGAVLTAYTLAQHPESAALRVCNSPESCPASSKRMPLECSPPSSSIYDWLSHSIVGDTHALQLDCHGNRPMVGQAEWLACRASFSPK